MVVAARRIEVAQELLRVLSVADELAKTSWPDPDLRHCQQDMESLDGDDHDDPQQLLR